MSENSTDASAQQPSGEQPDQTPQEGGAVDEQHTEGGYDQAAATEKIRKLNSEARNLRAKVKELEPKATELDQRKDAEKTEVDKLTESNSELSTRADSAERDLLRYKAAVKAGVAAEDIETFASRLQGNSADELDADAAELKKLFATNGEPQQRKPDRSQGATGGKGLSPADEFAAFMQNLK